MLTIIIPTKNRADFIARLLGYYAATEYPYQLYIGDSSEGQQSDDIEKMAAKYGGKLKVKLFSQPNQNVGESIREMTGEIKTPYVAYLADDDLLTTGAAVKCVEFLEQNEDYSAATGRALLFSIDSPGPHGKFSGAGKYPQPSIEQESASRRLLQYLSNYSVSIFCVHRTAIWNTMWAETGRINDRSFAEEILPSCLSVIQGKIKQLDCLGLIRQGHDRRYLLPDTYDWLTSLNWFSSYQAFAEVLAKKLVKIDGVGDDEARATVKQAFWTYLHNDFKAKLRSRYGVGESKGTLTAKKILRPAWRKVKTVLNPKELSLTALLKENSPYHADFMPVYHAVAAPQQEKEPV